MDKELEELRKKKLLELQQQAALEEAIEEKEEQELQFEEQKKLILRSILTSDARERLARIKIARPEVVKQIENQLILLAQNGQLNDKINDEQLKILLSRIFPKKKEFRIRRR